MSLQVEIVGTYCVLTQQMGNTSSNVLEILGPRVEGPANKVVDREGLGENTGNNIDFVNYLAAVQAKCKTKN